VDPLADKAPAWTPYRFGLNNPMRYTDPTGMGEEDETSVWTILKQGFTSYFNNQKSRDDDAIQEIENAKNPDQVLVENVGRQAASGELGEKAAKLGIQVADGVVNQVGDGATYVGVAGIAAAPFTGGSSLTLTAYAFTTATVCDATSAGIRTTDAIMFDSSFEPAVEKAGSALVSELGGRGLDKAMGQFVTKTGLSNTLYRAAAGSSNGGQFINNSTGISVEIVKYSIQSTLGIIF